MKTNDVVSQIGLTIVVEEEETVKSSLSKTTEEKYMKQSSRTYSMGIVSPTMKEGTRRQSLEEKSVGNKEILAKVMKEIQYEDATIKDFSPDLEVFSYIQAFISFCVHAISLLFGSPFSSIILMPLLGYSVCLKRMFYVPLKSFVSTHVGHNVVCHSYGYPAVIWALLFRKKYSGIVWMDLYLVAFPISMYLIYITLKYGLLPKKDFKRMFDRYEKKDESREYVAPMLMRTGMKKSSEETLKVYVRQLQNIVAKMPKIKKDFLVMPLGFTCTEGPNVRKKVITNIVHNRQTFSFRTKNIPGVTRQSSVEVDSIRKVKTIALGKAMLEAFEMYRETSMISVVHKVACTVSIVYVFARIIMLIIFRDSISMGWDGWVCMLILFYIKNMALKQWYHHCALPLALFSKIRFLELRMGRIIHQLHVEDAEAVHSWKRLRTALRMMDMGTLTNCVVYTAASLAGTFVYMAVMAVLTALYANDPGINIINDKISGVSSIILLQICLLHVLVAQGFILLAIRKGAYTNFLAMQHIDEWLKVKIILAQNVEKHRLHLNRISKKIKKTKEGLDATGIQESIIKLEGASIAIDVLCKQLRNEILVGGLRFFSLRMTKILFKTLLMLFLYEVYYSIIFFLDPEGVVHYFFMG